MAVKDLSRVSVAGIAARAGTHETSIYRRWKTRENLVLDALLSRSAAALPVPDTGSIRKDLITLLRRLSDYLSSPTGTALLQAAGLPVDDGLAQSRRAFWAERLAAHRVIIERAVERGELPRRTDPQLLLEMLVAPLHMRILRGTPIDRALPEQLTDLILDGVRRPARRRS